jgi:hypothetical protein
MLGGQQAAGEGLRPENRLRWHESTAITLAHVSESLARIPPMISRGKKSGSRTRTRQTDHSQANGSSPWLAKDLQERADAFGVRRRRQEAAGSKLGGHARDNNPSSLCNR